MKIFVDFVQKVAILINKSGNVTRFSTKFEKLSIIDCVLVFSGNGVYM
jgi:hypothetical protein